MVVTVFRYFFFISIKDKEECLETCMETRQYKNLSFNFKFIRLNDFSDHVLLCFKYLYDHRNYVSMLPNWHLLAQS